MSRTKRYIPHWARSERPYRLTWVGLGIDVGPMHGEDPRNRWQRGYDKHKATSGVRANSGRYDYREEYTGVTRKFYKRRWHKENRREKKKMICEILNE